MGQSYWTQNLTQKSESNLITIEHKNMGLYKKKSLINNLFGAARETRTLTGEPPLGPQPSLSTNSSIAAYASE